MAQKKPTGEALADAVRERTGYAVRDVERLERALTHSSARRQAGADYERLEFLGDRVLGLVVADMLFRTYPRAPEGELAVRLNALVSGATCAEVADEIGLTPLIRTDSGLRSLDGPKGRSTRGDVMEALLAVIYLDGGLEAARPLIEKHWGARSREGQGAQRDAKTALQEWAHQAAGTPPSYAVTSREGPDHDPVFTVEVTVGALAPTVGSGRSKRDAEQASAAAMLVREGVWPKPEERP